MTCPACGGALQASGRFCPACGSPAGEGPAGATRTLLGPRPAARGSAAPPGDTPGAGPPRLSAARAASVSRPPSSDSLDHGRFVPGQLLLERYRVVGLLGRGGMGEVYRADDLRLGQPVALKFLPAALAADPDRLERFHSEVRTARQVSHPNVCRVYDIGDYEGGPFLSMEYVDGEDLQTLLRRIGRLPRDKAIEIARQLCAGLAAAHERGVLHRDLKPANVMLDGRGRARITDFGLAALAGGEDARATRAGTPAYMAPEILGGGPASVPSDLYALGLVLYEVFTGRRAFGGDTLAEIRQKHEHDAPTPPSTLVDGFDPVVERVILRCLEKDPRQRPASALAVGAALPGGDPLAMALAAGETPSPEMVAAAGETGALSAGRVWLALAAIAFGLAALVVLQDRTDLLRLVPPPKEPAVLMERARDILSKAGVDAPPAGVYDVYGSSRSYLEYLQSKGAGADLRQTLRRPDPAAVYFYYRQSPRPLLAFNVTGRVGADDPPPIVPGMAEVVLTGGGSLLQLTVVPPQIEDAAPKAMDTDWGPLLAAAGLDASRLHDAPSTWNPAVSSDRRVAWTGAHPGAPELNVRVEAASDRGRPVSFQVVWPWTRPLRMRPFEASAPQKTANTIILVLLVSTIAIGAVLARRNLRAGRGDRKGAARLAAVLFAARVAGFAGVAAHTVSPVEEWSVVTRLAGASLFTAGIVWLFYLALEPLARRRHPEAIISWTRLVAGRFGDPLVGRHLLIGLAAGLALGLEGVVPHLVRAIVGGAPPLPSTTGLDVLTGPGAWISAVATGFVGAVEQSMILLVPFVAVQSGRRQRAIAGAIFFAVISVVVALSAWDQGRVVALASGLWIAGLFFLVVTRFGLLPLTVVFWVGSVTDNFHITYDLGAWYAGAGLFALTAIVALAAWGARAALAGQSLLGSVAAES